MDLRELKALEIAARCRIVAGDEAALPFELLAPADAADDHAVCQAAMQRVFDFIRERPRG